MIIDDSKPYIACQTPTPGDLCLPCAKCEEPHACFSVNLAALASGEAFTCLECDGGFTFDQMRNLVNRWALVLPRVAVMAEAIGGDFDGVGEDGLPTAHNDGVPPYVRGESQ